jgi:hypothetical protein
MKSSGEPEHAAGPSAGDRDGPADSRRTERLNQQSGECIYITNMQNMDSALFCILVLGFAYFLHIGFGVCIYNNNSGTSSSLIAHHAAAAASDRSKVW